VKLPPKQEQDSAGQGQRSQESVAGNVGKILPEIIHRAAEILKKQGKKIGVAVR